MKIFILLIVLIVLIFFYHWSQGSLPFRYNKEYFTDYNEFLKLNDYVPYYENKIINVKNNSYLWENDKEWFLKKLDNYKSNNIKDSILLNEINFNSDIVGLFLVKDILKNDFKIIKSKTLKANNSIWKNGLCDIVLSNHIIHRDNKLYGILIDLHTLIDKKTKKIYLIDYKFLGYVTEDQLDEEKEYDSKYVCNYLKKIQADRGITPSQNDFCKN